MPDLRQQSQFSDVAYSVLTPDKLQRRPISILTSLYLSEPHHHSNRRPSHWNPLKTFQTPLSSQITPYIPSPNSAAWQNWLQQLFLRATFRLRFYAKSLPLTLSVLFAVDSPSKVYNLQFIKQKPSSATWAAHSKVIHTPVPTSAWRHRYPESTWHTIQTAARRHANTTGQQQIL